MGMTDTGGDPPITHLLHVLGAQLHQLGTRFAASEDLHATDVQALSVLALSGGELHAGALATALELSSAATTRLVDRLERAGHVARRPDPDDARRRCISITPTATATAEAYFGQLARAIEEVLADHDEHEEAVIRRFLMAVIDVTAGHATRPADTTTLPDPGEQL